MEKEDQVQTNCGGWLDMLGRTLDQLLIAAGQLEPPLQQGRSRLRWKCVSALVLSCIRVTRESLTDLLEMWKEVLW